MHADAAGDEVACRRPSTGAGSSPAATQTCSLDVGGVLGLDVGGAVLEAEQVARGRLRGRWSTTSARTRAATSAPRRRAERRCGPGCGRRARRPAGRRRTPARRGRRRCAPGPGGRPGSAAGRQRGRARRGEPEPVAAVGVANSVGPNPNVSVRPGGGSPSASPVSSRRRLVRAADRPVRTGRLALGHAAPRPRSTPASSATSSSRDVVVTSNAAKCSRSWAGVTMPAWCSRRTGTPPPRSAGRRRRRGDRAAHAAPTPRRRRRPRRGPGTERRGSAARRETAGARRWSSARATAAVSCDSGSLRRVDRVGELLDLLGA